MAIARRDFLRSSTLGIAGGLLATAPIDLLAASRDGALKEGLQGMSHVRLYPPMDTALSSGLVCFYVEGISQSQVVNRLREEHRIVA